MWRIGAINITSELMSIFIVLRIFPFIYIASGCLLFLFLVFSPFHLNFSVLLLPRTIGMRLRQLRPFLHVTVRRTLSWIIYSDMVNVCMIVASAQCMFREVNRRYIIGYLISIRIPEMGLILNVGATVAAESRARRSLCMN